MLPFRPSLLVRFLVALSAVSILCCAQTTWTLVIVNGKIWTGNPGQREAQAVAIAGNRIAAVGTTEEIVRAKPENVPQLDLAGRRMLPGFNDAHALFRRPHLRSRDPKDSGWEAPGRLDAGTEDHGC